MFLYLKICYFVMFQFHNNKVIKIVRELYPLFDNTPYIHHKSITVKLPAASKWRRTKPAHQRRKLSRISPQAAKMDGRGGRIIHG